LSVNLGLARPIKYAKKSGITGINKEPVAESVRITASGLAGDTVCDKRHHGGPDQAVYLYGAPDYVWWSDQLQQELAPGTFGDNLTLGGMESASHSIGDRFHIGEAILEVTAPRIPCSTL